MSSVTIAEPVPATRMRSADRRALVIEAATAVFGERGYVGATTDAIAKAAGVSQPYVVRMFGTKEQLFLAVLQRALDLVLVAFHDAIEEAGPEPSAGRADLHARIGHAYADLLGDRGLLLSLMHGFILGSDPAIGTCVREGFLEIYRVLREEAGFGPEEVRAFLADGMLLNTLVGIRMVDAYDTSPWARELLEVALPTKLAFLRSIDGQ